MKRFIFFLSFIAAFQVSGQKHPLLTKLSNQVIDKNQSDSLNLVSIFNWITDNIAYDTKTYFNGLSYPDFRIDRYQDSVSYLNDYNRAVSEMVIRNKRAICDGYSRLFYVLCEMADIKCQYITGKAKIPMMKELGEHAWNAVFMNGKWQLLDLTWASGSLSGSRFIKEKEMFFYFTPPEQLIYDHFPDDPKWSLLDPEKVEYLLNETPIKSHRPFRAGLVDYYPKSKKLKLDSLKTFKITLELDREIDPFDIYISGSPAESLIDQMGIEVTDDNYDSLANVDKDLFALIPKIEIINKEVSGFKHEYTIKVLSKNLKQIDVNINSSWPSLVYNVEIK